MAMLTELCLTNKKTSAMKTHSTPLVKFNALGSLRKTPITFIIATEEEKKVMTQLSLSTYAIMIVVFIISLSVLGH